MAFIFWLRFLKTAGLTLSPWSTYVKVISVKNKAVKSTLLHELSRLINIFKQFRFAKKLQNIYDQIFTKIIAYIFGRPSIENKRAVIYGRSYQW